MRARGAKPTLLGVVALYPSVLVTWYCHVVLCHVYTCCVGGRGDGAGLYWQASFKQDVRWEIRGYSRLDLHLGWESLQWI